MNRRIDSISCCNFPFPSPNPSPLFVNCHRRHASTLLPMMMDDGPSIRSDDTTRHGPILTTKRHV